MRVESPWKGLVLLQNRPKKAPSCLDQDKDTLTTWLESFNYKPESWPLPNTESSGLDLGPLAFRTVRNTFLSLLLVSHSVQFSSVAQSCLTLCDPMNCSMPGLPVYHQLPESTQTHVCWVSDAFQPSHPLLSPSPPALNPSQHQGLFQWVSSLHQVAKVLEFQLQHQSFHWIFRTDLL